LTRIAGCGIPGYSGDGGLAINAKLNVPTAVLVDPSNNIYIADSKNYAIRKITTNPISVSLTANVNIANQYAPKSGCRRSADISISNSIQLNNIFEPIPQMAIPTNGLSIVNSPWTVSSSTNNSSASLIYTTPTSASTYWQDASGQYTGTGGIYNGTFVTPYCDLSNAMISTSTNSTIAGEWIQLQLPFPMKVTEYNFMSSPNLSGEPTKWALLGSTNGGTWFLESSGALFSYDASRVVRTFPASSPAYYNTHRFVINTISGGDISANLCQLQLFGIYDYTGATSSPSIQTKYSNIEQICPPIGIQANSNSIVYNNCTYDCSASFYMSNLPYLSLRNIIPSPTSMGWDPSKNYNSGTGIYSGTTSTLVYNNNVIQTFNGEWIQVAISKPSKVTSFGLSCYTCSGGIFTLVGSNDGTTWFMLYTTSPITMTTAAIQWFPTNTNYSTNYYTYYRLVVSQLATTTMPNNVTLNQWKLVGTFM
jgi:hypothetical protein